MANHLARVLVRFEARVHNTKNRLVAIPVDVQRQLRLVRQADNHLLLTGADDIIYAENCRPLMCTEDDDCAQFSDLAYTCRTACARTHPMSEQADVHPQQVVRVVAEDRPVEPRRVGD